MAKKRQIRGVSRKPKFDHPPKATGTSGTMTIAGMRVATDPAMVGNEVRIVSPNSMVQSHTSDLIAMTAAADAFRVDGVTSRESASAQARQTIAIANRLTDLEVGTNFSGDFRDRARERLWPSMSAGGSAARPPTQYRQDVSVDGNRCTVLHDSMRNTLRFRFSFAEIGIDINLVQFAMAHVNLSPRDIGTTIGRQVIEQMLSQVEEAVNGRLRNLL